MKIQLLDTFIICPEGVHVFRISNVKEDEAFSEITLTLKTADGYTDTERYTLVTVDGEVNQGAASAFSRIARCALQNSDISEIEPAQLVGKYIKANVKHTVKESTKEAGKTVTFTSINDIDRATEAEYLAAKKEAAPAAPAPVSTPAVATQPAPAPATPKKTGGFDLDALFGKK